LSGVESHADAMREVRAAEPNAYLPRAMREVRAEPTPASSDACGARGGDPNAYLLKA
jgi:hypothetical protein